MLGEHLLDLLQVARHRALAAQPQHAMEMVDLLHSANKTIVGPSVGLCAGNDRKSLSAD